MASGAINGSFTGAPTSQMYPRIEWSSKANVSANTSTVTAVLYFIRLSSAWQPWNANGHTCKISIHTNSASANRTFDLRNTSKQEIWRRTVTLGHNSDGTLSIGLNAGGATGVTLGSYAVSGMITLDKIARASSMAWVTADSPHTFGKTQRFTVTAASSAYYHTVECRLNGTLLGVLLKNSRGGGTKSLVMPLDWANKFPNTTKATGFSFRLITHTHPDGDYNGSKLIGFKDYPLSTCDVPTSMVPTVKSIAVSDPLTNVPSILGITNTTNQFVQGMSNIRFTADANISYSSPIKSWKYECDGNTIATNNGNIKDIPLSQYNLGSGAKVIKVTMTDGRGRSVSKDFTVNITAYQPPQIITATAERVNNGTVVKFTKSAKVSSVKVGTTEKNQYTAKTEYKTSTATTWTVGKTETNAFANVNLDGFAVGSSYDIRITLADKFNTVTSTMSISTAKTLLHMFKDEGVGIGKMREKGVLDVSGETYFDGNQEITGVVNAKSGFTPIPLTSGADANSLTASTGFYVANTAELARSILNTPVTGASNAAIKIINIEGCQTIYYCDASNPIQWMRIYDPISKSWSQWWKNAGRNPSGAITGEIATGWGTKVNARRLGNLVTLSMPRVITSKMIAGENFAVAEKIPAEYRPAAGLLAVMNVSKNNGGAVTYPAIMTIDSGGSIKWTNGSTGNFVYAGSVSYITDQWGAL